MTLRTASPTSAPRPLDSAGSPGAIDGIDPAADRATLAILNDPRFADLVRERTGFAWLLSALMLAVYLAFILLVAFDRDLMASKLGGGDISLGIVLGLFVIVFAFALTGVYVGRANTRFDTLTKELRQ